MRCLRTPLQATEGYFLNAHAQHSALSWGTTAQNTTPMEIGERDQDAPFSIPRADYGRESYWPDCRLQLQVLVFFFFFFFKKKKKWTSTPFDPYTSLAPAVSCCNPPNGRCFTFILRYLLSCTVSSSFLMLTDSTTLIDHIYCQLKPLLLAMVWSWIPAFVLPSTCQVMLEALPLVSSSLDIQIYMYFE